MNQERKHKISEKLIPSKIRMADMFEVINNTGPVPEDTLSSSKISVSLKSKVKDLKANLYL